MLLVNIALQVGLLWFFITYFTRSTDASESGRQAVIVVVIMVAANLILALTLKRLLGDFTSLLAIPILYFAVSIICQTPRRITWWITGSYFVTSLLLGLAFSLLAS